MLLMLWFVAVDYAGTVPQTQSISKEIFML